MAAPVGHILCLDKLESVDTLCVCVTIVISQEYFFVVAHNCDRME